MSELQVVARLKIHEGKLEEFKNAASACKAIVKEKDTQTLQYDWFLNGAGTECIVLEKYTSSEALLEHVGNLGDTLGTLMACSDFSGKVHGHPSDQLVEAVAAMDIAFYRPL